MKLFRLSCIMSFLIVVACPVFATTYYVDSESGSDSNDGLSESTAFQTLAKVNAFPFKPGDRVLFKSTGLWRGTFKPHSGEPGNPIYYGAYGVTDEKLKQTDKLSAEDRRKLLDSAQLPQFYNSKDYSDPALWSEVSPNIWVSKEFAPSDPLYLPCDVGNIIFAVTDSYGKEQNSDHLLCGVKKWSLDNLKQPHDYYYNPDNHRVYIYHQGAPTADCPMFEMALRQNIIEQGGCHDIVYENLALAYGAAHGFGGGSVKRITIQNCRISFIGGGHQFTTESGRPVRFGNGIEFWSCAEDMKVVGNLVYQIYDAALTNQGRAPSDSPHKSIERNILWTKNVISFSEYSFEYWNGDSGQITENVQFVDNDCYDAGYGWAHNQRPDINGAHLMFYHNSAQTKNFVVANNRFLRSTEVCLRMENDWRSGLTMKDNVYSQTENRPVIRWLIKNYYGVDDFEKYQQETGMDKGSTASKE